jgi:hypothetical protein
VPKLPPFSMLRAAFWLLAAVILTELITTLATVVGCFWLIIVTAEYKLGACSNVSIQIREIWAEMLAAILALLLASRGSNGGPPRNGKDGDTP